MQATPLPEHAEPLQTIMTEQTSKPNKLEELHRSGRYAELIELHKKRYELLCERYGSEHGKVGLALKEQAGTYYEMQNYAASEELLRKSMAILEQHYERARGPYAVCLANLSRMCVFTNRFLEAETIIAEIFDLTAELPVEEQIAYTAALINQAKMHQRQGDFDLAERSLESARGKMLQQVGKDHRYYGQLLHHFSEVYWNQKRFDKAEQAIRDSLDIFRNASLVETADYAMAASFLGVLLAARGDLSDALNQLTTALDILKRVRPAEHPNIQQISQRIASVKERQKKESDSQREV